MSEHGYIRYTRGCRCDTCRSAKAAYTREKRAEATRARQLALASGVTVYVAPNTTHGLSGYQNHGCRCIVCRRADKAAEVRQHRRKAAAT